MCRRPFLVRWCKALIIGVALVALAGCSSIRLGYNNGPTLVWWWLDGYVDFDRSQAGEVRAGINRLFDWHRATQLMVYAEVLAEAQGVVEGDIAAATACQWQERVRTLFDPTVERVLVEAATLLPGLSEAQFSHIAQRQAKSLDEARRNFLQPDAAERERAAVRRFVERAERLYGRLNAEQRALVAEQLRASPFDAERWMAERERRQQFTLDGLRRLASADLSAQARVEGLRRLMLDLERTDDAEQRAYQRRLAEHNCALGARLHNATTPAQRTRAANQLRRWEDDLRVLAPELNG